MPRITDIDRLYGLEPVFEPSDATGGEGPESFADVSCPYCGETILLHLDLSAGSQSYVEDCQVCCQPMQVGLQVNDEGSLDSVTAERMDR